MNNSIIGTAGHVDHGKTCLIRTAAGRASSTCLATKNSSAICWLAPAALIWPC